MHLWRSSSCKDHMEKQQSQSRATVDDGCPEIVSTMRRHCYDVQSTCLNQGMDTDPPSHTPFEEFDYGTNGNDGNDYDYDDDKDNDINETFCNGELNQLPITTMLFSGIDNTASPAVVNALMECIRANERHAVMVLQHDVEHLKILEDGQCPDYMLHKVLMWVYNAKSIGFDFNPKAMSRKANI